MLWRALRPPRQADAAVETEFRWILLLMFMAMLVPKAAPTQPDDSSGEA